MTKHIRLILAFGLLVALLSRSNAQTAPLAEMRGAWIATVVNIDWPSSSNLSTQRQQMEFDSILDVLKAMGTNAVFVQIRPAGDAFYPNKLAPWSKYLTGQQGKAPEPMYDPLQYMIDGAHQRRMEFHAWLNPYRATFDLDTASLAPTHPIRTLPKDRLSEWVFPYGGKYYFNPASPFVRRYLVNIVSDILLRYDVDGIHFDDYFYPYPTSGQPLNDYGFFASDPRGFSKIEDWRRDNVTKLIQDVSKAIRDVKPYVKFGISPTGVWRNIDKDPINGSATRAGLTSYDDLYADVLLWLQKGYIDYVAPQVYWSIGFPPADYQVLADWWGRHSYGQQVYIGQAAYKVGNDANDPSWNNPDQLQRQISLNRLNPRVQGSILFSSKTMVRNTLGVRDSLIKNVYSRQALLPALKSRSPKPPAAPQICNIKGTDRSVKLGWNTCDLLSGDEMPYYFAVFRFNGDQIGDIKDPANLIGLSAFNPAQWIYEDQSVAQGAYYTYVIQAYNRFHVESQTSTAVMIKKTKKGIKKKRKLFGLYW
ncbi:MAG: family 10 glycosylhydrolase [Lewinellaceae bacterium]|nr:family 10 glycosylhydrolase [Lewinellaceae bacterium]